MIFEFLFSFWHRRLSSSPIVLMYSGRIQRRSPGGSSRPFLPRLSSQLTPPSLVQHRKLYVLISSSYTHPARLDSSETRLNMFPLEIDAYEAEWIRRRRFLSRKASLLCALFKVKRNRVAFCRFIRPIWRWNDDLLTSRLIERRSKFLVFVIRMKSLKAFWEGNTRNRLE